MDASAAIGIVERRGLAKVRHVDTDVLWLQEVEARRKLPICKVAGASNPADLMTKNLDAGKINQHVLFTRLAFAEGRAAAASKLHSVVSGLDT